MSSNSIGEVTIKRIVNAAKETTVKQTRKNATNKNLNDGGKSTQIVQAKVTPIRRTRRNATIKELDTIDSNDDVTSTRKTKSTQKISTSSAKKSKKY